MKTGIYVSCLILFIACFGGPLRAQIPQATWMGSVDTERIPYNQANALSLQASLTLDYPTYDALTVSIYRVSDNVVVTPSVAATRYFAWNSYIVPTAPANTIQFYAIRYTFRNIDSPTYTYTYTSPPRPVIYYDPADNTNPEPISSLAVTSRSFSKIAISWQNPSWTDVVRLKLTYTAGSWTRSAYLYKQGGLYPNTFAGFESVLSANTQYTIAVVAEDFKGNVSPVTTLTAWTKVADSTAPTAPGTISTSQVGYESATVSWGASTDPAPSSGNLTYSLNVKETVSGQVVGDYTAITATSFAITSNLKPNTQYTATVKCADDNGNISPPTTGNFKTLILAPPTSLSGTVTSSTATVNWASGPKVAYFNVYINSLTVPVKVPWNASSMTTTFTGLRELYDYRITVESVATSGEVSSTRASCTLRTLADSTPDTQPPTAPQIISVYNVTESSLSLTWSRSDDNRRVDKYQIDCNGVVFETLADGGVVPPALSKDLTGLAPTLAGDNSLFRLKVRAVDGANNPSEWSATYGAAPPVPLTDLSPGALPGSAGDLAGKLQGELRVTSSGSASASYTLPTPPGRGGYEPSLFVNYSSVAGNGVLGVGWSVSTGFPKSITRGRSIRARDGVTRGVLFDNTLDNWYLDGKLLICVSGVRGSPAAVYRTEVDGFCEIKPQYLSGTLTGFVMQNKDGSTYYFGKIDGTSDGFQVAGDETNNTLAYEYALKKASDARGYEVTFQYKDIGAEWILERISYTGGNGRSPETFVDFAYETNRADAPSSYLAGRKFNHRARLKLITTKRLTPTLTNYSHYVFDYLEPSFDSPSASGRSRLRAIKAYFVDPQDFSLKKIADTTFEWSVSTEGLSATSEPVVVPTDSVYNRVAWGSGPFPPKRLYSQPAGSSTALSVRAIDQTGSGTQTFFDIGGYNLTTESAEIKSSSFDAQRLFEKCFSNKVLISDGYDPGRFIRLHGGGILGRISTGDFNGDGKDDVLAHGLDGCLYISTEGLGGIAQKSSGRVGGGGVGGSYLDAMGNYSAPQYIGHGFPETFISPMVVDLNGDGLKDYAFIAKPRFKLEIAGTIQYTERASFMYAALANPDGTFGSSVMMNFFPSPTVGVMVKENYVKLDDALLGAFPGDFNGDGLTDFMVLDNKNIYFRRWILYISRGQGSAGTPLFEAIYGPMPNEFTSGSVAANTYHRPCTNEGWPGQFYSSNIQGNPNFEDFLTVEGAAGAINTLVTDVNGDGLDDFVWYASVKTDGSVIAETERSWWVMLSQGKFKQNGAFNEGFSQPLRMSMLSGIPVNGPKTSLVGSRISQTSINNSVDVDGDGHKDYSVTCQQSGSDTGNVMLFKNTATTFPDLITSVSDGFGRVDRIEYKSGCHPQIYTSGVSVSYPIQNKWNSAPVVSAMKRDIGGTDPASFTYQYSGYRMDVSGRGSLGYQAFVTRDVQNATLQYQFLAQSFPMTGMTVREQTFKEVSAGKLRLLSTQSNSVVFDRVLDSSGSTLGTVFPFVVKSATSRWEYTPTPHYDIGSANFGTSLYSSSLPANAYVNVAAQSWFDDMDQAQDPLVGRSSAIAGYYTNDDNAGTNSPTGKMGSADQSGTLQTYLGSFPGKIKYGNLKKLQTDYGSGYVETVTKSYLAPVGTLSGRVDSIDTSVQSPAPYNTQTAPRRSFTYLGNTSLVKTETVDATDATLDLATTTDYDNYRPVKQTISGYSSPGSLQHVGTFVASEVPVPATDFDNRFDLPKVKRDAVGQIVSTVYDGLKGLPISITDPNNLVTTTSYDALGRVVSSTDTFAVTTTIQYVADTSQTVTPPTLAGAQTLQSAYRKTVTQTQKPEVTTYFDRLGRAIRTVKTGYNEQKTTVDTIYNYKGEVIAVSNPYPSSGTVLWTTTVYDDVGRVKTVTLPNGTITNTSYTGKIITATITTADSPSRTRTTSTQTDAKGRTVKVWNEDNAVAVSNVETGETTTQPSVEFVLDGFGRMRQTKLKGQTQVIQADYDELGRQIKLDDPDKGVWTYLSDGLGRVVKQTDANTTAVETIFDVGGRPLKRTTKQSSTGNPTELATWYYYAATTDATKQTVAKGSNGWIGALERQEAVCTATPGYKVGGASPLSRTVYYYTAKGLPSIVLNQADGKFFYTNTDYDSYGRAKEVRHFWRPATKEDPSVQPFLWQSFGYTYTYSNRGYIEKIADNLNRTWWEIGAGGYDYMDRPTLYKVGNGHTTTRGYRASDGLLTSIQTGASSSIQNLAFTWDGLGNLTSRSDTGSASSGSASESFDYDVLNRLTTHDGVQSAVYAANGNVLRKADIGRSLDSADFVYSSTKPHAVQSARGYTYNYDANGNLVSRTHATQGTLTATWTGFDMPRFIWNTSGSSTAGLEYVYNSAHSRTIELEFDGTSGGVPTHYTKKRVYAIGSTLEINYDNTASSGEQWQMKKVRIYVPGPAGVVGSREFDPGGSPLTGSEKAYVYHYDHLGSIVKITAYGDSGTNLASNMAGKTGSYAYEPWGLRVNPGPHKGALTTTAAGGSDDLTPRGYTGHEMLETLGLVHMNGRIYDPKIGRMLSADPYIQFPGDLQSYNRYSYVQNNPLRYVDPTGHLVAAPVVLAVPVVREIALGAAASYGIFCIVGGQAALDAHTQKRESEARTEDMNRRGFAPLSPQEFQKRLQEAQEKDRLLRNNTPNEQRVDNNSVQNSSDGGKVQQTPPSQDQKQEVAKESDKKQETKSDSEAASKSAKFGSGAKLQDHYDRHGGDFGAKDANEYQAQASGFLTGSAREGVQETVRENGDVVRFDAKTNEFGVITKDGTIKTYYKPDPAVHGRKTNQEYFDDQKDKK